MMSLFSFFVSSERKKMSTEPEITTVLHISSCLPPKRYKNISTNVWEEKNFIRSYPDNETWWKMEKIRSRPTQSGLYAVEKSEKSSFCLLIILQFVTNV